MPWWLFAGVFLVMHCRRSFWLSHRVEAEALIGPQTSTPAPDILVSMSPGTHIMQQRCPKKQHGHVLAQTPTVPTGLSKSVRACLGSCLVTIVMPLRSWISQGQLVSSFCRALACLVHGRDQPGHQAGPLVISGEDTQMIRLVTGRTSG